MAALYFCLSVPLALVRWRYLFRSERCIIEPQWIKNCAASSQPFQRSLAYLKPSHEACCLIDYKTEEVWSVDALYKKCTSLKLKNGGEHIQLPYLHHSLWRPLPFFAILSPIWTSCWHSRHLHLHDRNQGGRRQEENAFPEVMTFCIPQTPSCWRHVFFAVCAMTQNKPVLW